MFPEAATSENFKQSPKMWIAHYTQLAIGMKFLNHMRAENLVNNVIWQYGQDILQ